MNPMFNGRPAAVQQGAPAAFTEDNDDTFRLTNSDALRTLRRTDAVAAPEPVLVWYQNEVVQMRSLYPSNKAKKEISLQTNWPADKLEVWLAHAIREVTLEVEDAYNKMRKIHKMLQHAGKKDVLPQAESNLRPKAAEKLEEMFASSIMHPQDTTWEDLVIAITTHLTDWNASRPPSLMLPDY